MQTPLISTYLGEQDKHKLSFSQVRQPGISNASHFSHWFVELIPKYKLQSVQIVSDEHVAHYGIKIEHETHKFFPFGFGFGW